MLNIQEVADKADLIVNGYAFTKCNEGYRILNLNKINHAAVLSVTGEILETTMDDIELDIVKNYFENNKKYMEE
jgi:hypothetical protein